MQILFFFLFLTRSALAEPCPAVTEGAGYSVHDCGGVHVVRLSGTPVERARLLGHLVKSGKLSDEVLRYFTTKVDEVARDALGWLAGPVGLVYNQLVRAFHAGAPASMEEEVDALAKELGVDPIVLRRGLSLPDTGVFLHGLGSLPLLHAIPTTGCSSVAAKLPGGGFAYGRNLDFAGVGTWDRHPMVLAVEPAPGSGELRHLVIGADGVPFAGITGANEAGLTFAVHQNFSRDISLSGTPMLFVGEQLMRRARSLEEAVELLRALRPGQLWTFVLTDLRGGRAVAVESSSRAFRVRWAEGNVFTQTNHVRFTEASDDETASEGTRLNSEFRAEKLAEHAARAQGVGDLAQALAWQEDKLGQLSAFHDVLKSETIQTVLFEARPGAAPVVAVSAEAAPASSGRFAEFNLARLLEGGTPEWSPRDFVRTDPEVRRRQQLFTMAYAMYFDERKPVEAAALMASQHTIDAALFRCAAMMNAGRFEDSLRLAEEALRDPRFTGEPAHIRGSLERVKLASLFRLRRGDEARALAESVLQRDASGGTPKALLELARRIRDGRAVPGWMTALHFDFFSGDLGGRKD